MTLFLLGFLTLFLELALIRYLPANIWNLGYFPNLVLLAVFVGMGIGFVFSHHFSTEKSKAIYRKVPAFILGLIIIVMALRPEIPGFSKDGVGDVGGELYFTTGTYQGTLTTIFLFLLWFSSIVVTFTMISQYTAKFFARYSPLKAYTLDIAGSCMGILAFMAISWFQLPAWTWFAALVPVFLATAEFKSRKQTLGVALPALFVVVILAAQDSKLIQDIKGYTQISEFVWSPYQRVKYKAGTLFVNGIAHQEINPPENLPKTFYSLPYQERAQNKDLPPYKRVLIIGAGSGNDVMTALINGVDHVDAVEIDPAIANFGKKYNPGKPYESPKVRLTIDDGRAFLTRAREKYDLVIMALTDSLVKVSPMAQLRLENFLFTKDTVHRAYELLNEGGSIVFYNYYRSDWLIRKLQTLLHEGSEGKTPKVLMTDGDFVVMKVTKAPETGSSFSVDPSLILPTDDWPFLYLKSKTIPSMYIAAMLFLAAFVGWLLVMLQKSESSDPSARAPHTLYIKAAFVFMGSAFLLLETKSVIQFSLLFGTTWLNSSLVFLAILVSVLAANWAAWLIKSESVIYAAFALLLASCFVTLVYPISNLLYLEDKTMRFILASALTFSPIFFANLIFSVAFRNQPVAERLFGWNLIGATIGGLLEYSSMALGYHSLMIVVAICYVLAFIMLVAARSRASVSVEGPLQTAESAT